MLMAFSFFLVIGFSVEQSFAQTEVVIEGGFGTINDAIMGDTLADGSRRDVDAVYVLKRDARYLTNGRVKGTQGYHLKIITEEGTGAPPIVQHGVRTDGTSDAANFEFLDDFTLQGMYILNQDDLGGEKRTGIIVNTAGVTGVLDGIYMEVTGWLGVRINVDSTHTTIKNSVIRNLISPADPGNGKFLDPRGNNPGSLYFENNTFYNMTSEIVRESGGFHENFFFNHNTVFNVAALSRNDARVHKSRIMNGTFTNNMFVNMAPLGDVTTDWDFFGGAVADPPDLGALFPLDSLAAQDLGFAESDRKVRINNNNVYFSQEMMDFFAGVDTVQVLSMLSTLGQAQLDSGDGTVTMGSMLNEDPGFTAPPDNSIAVAYATAWYSTFCQSTPVEDGCIFATNQAEWDPTVSIAASPWPLPEDFSYDTSTASYTGGTGGFPIGDLNWFPDQKEAWLAAGGGTGVLVSNELDEVPSGFALHGNFPNPFNPSTNVLLDLATDANVAVEVFDLAGRQVLSVPTQRMQAGTRQAVRIDAKNLASGVYFYQVNINAGSKNFAQNGKMVLMK